jgi:hypothetical protein
MTGVSKVEAQNEMSKVEWRAGQGIFRNQYGNVYITQKRGNTRYIVINQAFNPLHNRYTGVTNQQHPLHHCLSGIYGIPHSAFRTGVAMHPWF